jgi:hypothetical protein
VKKNLSMVSIVLVVTNFLCITSAFGQDTGKNTPSTKDFKPTKVIENPHSLFSQMINFAEGDIPTLIQIEKRFDFKFEGKNTLVDIANGIENFEGAIEDSMFSQNESPKKHNVWYIRSKNEVSMGFRFNANHAAQSDICIDKGRLHINLSKFLKTRTKELSHYPTRVEYFGEINGHQRVVTISPVYFSSNPCLTGFDITYQF